MCFPQNDCGRFKMIGFWLHRGQQTDNFMLAKGSWVIGLSRVPNFYRLKSRETVKIQFRHRIEVLHDR